MRSILIKYLCVISLVKCFSTASLLANADKNSRNLNEYRLPKNTVPVSYDLWLNINLQQLVFAGEVVITVFVQQRSNYIELNCKDLEIDQQAIKLMQNQAEIQLTNFQQNATTEKCRFEFNRELVEFINAELTISFEGKIRNDLKGLNSMSYTVGSEKRYLAATQFQATYARMVMPCYDEPAFKAIFKIKITHDTSLNALSNMPQTSRIVSGGQATTTFRDTPTMSTFIVAFIVSDYKFVESLDSKFRVFVPEHELSNAQYALSFTQKSLKFLEEYTGTSYSLPKLDLVALPELTFSAMENWGLITFRSDNLLYDESKTTAKTHQTISTIISHELVHMWFGNIVTPEWWEYLWLSEGFAEYFEFYVTSSLEPSWRVLDQFNMVVQSALLQDDTISARPMTRDLSTPIELNESFDYVPYAKSASVIRMMQTTLGKDQFRQALSQYIEERLYRLTNPDYLFEKLQKFNTVSLPSTVKNIFESWSNSPGYPVVQVTRNYDTSKVTIGQKRFFSDGTTNADQKYFVPITMTDGSNPNFEHVPAFDYWLTPTSNDMTIDFSKSEDWVLLNKLQHGYYRVNYDVQNWKLLTNELHGSNFTKIHHLNRAALIDDSFNLAKANFIDADIAMDILHYLKQEDDFIPWMAGYNALVFLTRMFRGSTKYQYLEGFMRNITSHSFKETGWILKDDHVTELHRTNIIYLACFAGHTDCVSSAKDIVNKMLDDPSFLPAENIQPAAFCAVAKYDDDVLNKIVAHLFQIITSTSSPDKKLLHRIIGGLGCASNLQVLTDALNLSLMPAPSGLPINIDSKDRQEIFRAITSGTVNGTQLGLEMLRTRYLDMSQRYDSMEILFRQLAPNLVTDELRSWFDLVLNDNRNKFETAQILKAAEKTQLEATKLREWSSSHMLKIEQWLEKHNFNLTDGGAGGGDGDDASMFKISWLLVVLLFLTRFRIV